MLKAPSQDAEHKQVERVKGIKEPFVYSVLFAGLSVVDTGHEGGNHKNAGHEQISPPRPGEEHRRAADQSDERKRKPFLLWLIPVQI